MPGCWQITSKRSLEIFSCMQSANLSGITLSLRQAFAVFLIFLILFLTLSQDSGTITFGLALDKTD